MKTDLAAKDPTNHSPHGYAYDGSDESTTFEDKFFTVVSLGTIISGALACLASVGVGISLVLLGSMVFAEL